MIRARPAIMVSSRSKRWAKSFLLMNGPLLNAATPCGDTEEIVVIIKERGDAAAG